MKRVLIPLVIAAGLFGPPAQAQTSEQRIVSELREQGFTRVEIRRTLLGRTRIVATSPTYTREIVINPASGVILRDYLTARGADRPSGGVGAPNLRDGGNGSDFGGGGGGDDDDDGDSGGGSDDDGDSSDGGGSDSGNSGSGGSGGGGSGGGGSDDSGDDDDDDGGSDGGDSDDGDDDDDGDD